jgi:hypothetical protein
MLLSLNTTRARVTAILPFVTAVAILFASAVVLLASARGHVMWHAPSGVDLRFIAAQIGALSLGFASVTLRAEALTPVAIRTRSSALTGAMAAFAAIAVIYLIGPGLSNFGVTACGMAIGALSGRVLLRTTQTAAESRAPLRINAAASAVPTRPRQPAHQRTR